jgi:hypothetical protein
MGAGTTRYHIIEHLDGSDRQIGEVCLPLIEAGVVNPQEVDGLPPEAFLQNILQVVRVVRDNCFVLIIL